MPQGQVATVRLRRLYALWIALALAPVLLVRVVLLGEKPKETPPPFEFVARGVLDNLAATLIVASVVVLILPWVIGKASEDVHSLLDSKSIGRVLHRTAQTTANWRVRARTANYFTSTVLGDLIKHAKTSHDSIHIEMILLDLSDGKLMDVYVKGRADSSADQSDRWDASRVRSEICASITRVAFAKGQMTRLSATIALSPVNWVVSLDMSDAHAVLTGQNSGTNAIMFEKTSPMYTAWKADFETHFESCQRFEVPVMSELTAESVNRLLASINLAGTLSAAEIDKTLQLVKPNVTS